MEPFRKKFETHPSFPFAFVYKDTKNLQSELAEHIHDWYELVYVYEGKGTFFIDQTIYDMQQGDIFIIPGNTIHRAFPDKENPVTSTAIFFSPMLVMQASLGDAFSYLKSFEQSKYRKNYQINHLADLQQTFETVIEQIQHEIQAKKLGHRHAIVLMLQQILLNLNRCMEPKDSYTTAASTKGPIWMNQILLYIDQHLTENISLATLTARALMTPAHFSRVFKQLTGMNITEYITAKRIIAAKELLLDTDHNISSIAEMSGFESLPHFHRMFKRIAGMTPATFKKAYRTTLQNQQY